MAHAKHPLLGDPVYGKKGLTGLPEGLASFNRQALHARSIGFVHPSTGEAVSFDCPLADDMQNLLEILSVQSD